MNKDTNTASKITKIKPNDILEGDIMTKQEALNELARMKADLEQQKSFRGQTSLLTNIRKRMYYLSLYAVDGNIPGLLVKECEKEKAAIST